MPAPRRSADEYLFPTYVEQVLVPTLKPGDIVIADNFASHKGRRSPRYPSGWGPAPPAAEIFA